MLIKSIEKCKYFQMQDKTVLCELLHPKNEDITLGCSIAHAIIEPGKSSLPHKLESSVEVYYILDGEGTMHIDNEESEVKTGDAIHIPPGSIQWIKNKGVSHLKFLCVVSPPWKAENEKLCH